MRKLILSLIFVVSFITIFSTLTCYAWEEKMDELIQNDKKAFEHPFLLADSERLAKLSAVGSEEPWKSMKEEALKQASKLRTDRNNRGDLTLVQAMYDVINYNTLGFILDPQNAEVYKQRVLTAISYFDKSNPDTAFGCIYTEDGDNWNGSIPPGNTFASAVIALDIMYPSLTKAEIDAAEFALQCVADAFWAKTEVHLANTWGVRGIWAAYCQDYEVLKQCYDEWLYQYHDSFNSDGGQLASVEYAYVRYAASERNAKILLPYIMEYMGLDNTFFADEKNIAAIEHLLGYTYAPDGDYWIFGDTIIGNGINPQKNLGAYIAPKYSPEAAGYGAFSIGGDYGAGTMLKLLLGNDDGSVSAPTPPPSRIYNKTGAFFYEDYSNKNSLAGVMYNQDKTAKVNGHSHTETNSIGLYAYGKMLMANSGYAGFASGSLGYTWKYIQTSAASANTVLINYEPGDLKNPSEFNDHNNQWHYREPGSYTNGIVNGFTNDLLCYAKGDSGAAIPNGKHYRSFVMVSSQDHVPGYFVEFDEIQTNNEGDVATVIQRPLSVNYEELTPDTEYEWTVSGEDGNDVKLSVFMANEPDSVEFWDAITASTSTSVPLKSMFAKYVSGKDKNIRVSTILFPSDMNNKKSDMKRINTAGAEGARISHPGGITDYVFSSKGGECTYFATDKNYTDYTNYDKLTFVAKNVIIRKNNGINSMYFAEDGKKLICGEEGFEAKIPVTIFMKNGKGTIEAAQSTDITFYGYGITGVKINGEPVEAVSLTDGKITVTVPAGVSEAELVYDSQKALGQMLAGEVANKYFDKITVVDTVSGMMLNQGILENASVQMINSSTYISANAAKKILGGDYYGSAVALRLSAEAKGCMVKWHESGLVFVIPQGMSFDFEGDAPNLGLALKIFDLASQTDYVTNNVPDLSVYVNGNIFKDFDPCIYSYTVPTVGDEFEITAVCDLPVSVAEISEGVKQLTADIGKSKVIYTFTHQKLEKDDIIITASAEPQPENSKENALDGNLGTRWSAEGIQWICFEFTEPRAVSALSIAWHMGDQRKAVYEVEISDDGEEWKSLFSGASSGTTLEPELVKTGEFKTKYVRITCSGTSAGSWNSVAEAVFDFKE